MSEVWPDGAGEFMFSLFGDPAVMRDGPPYTHTFRPPEPVGEDEDGNPVYPEPGPAHTLTDASDPEIAAS